MEEIKNTTEETATPETQEKKKKPAKKETEKLEEKIAELEAQLLEKEDRILRLAAEYDNFRRRSREEREAAYSAALADAVSEFLPLTDNLERAQQFDDADKVRDGLVMIAKSVESVFAKLGIEEVGLAGEQFDPNIHEAIMHIEDENLGENTVAAVLQKGYKFGDTVVRPAMVQVAN